MDMSIKLNLSYPATKPANEAVVLDKVAAKPPVVEAQASSTDSKSSQQQDEKVKAAAVQIQEFLHTVQRNLEFSIDENSGRVVVKVIASDSGLVIRQIPNEEVLKLAESLNDAKSALFSAQV